MTIFASFEIGAGPVDVDALDLPCPIWTPTGWYPFVDPELQAVSIQSPLVRSDERQGVMRAYARSLGVG